MRSRLLYLPLLYLYTTVLLSAAQHVVIPNCCATVSNLEVIDPATGALVHLVAGPSGLGGSGFVVSPDGTEGFALGATLTRFSLSSGQTTGSLTVPGTSQGLSINPKTHALYVDYYDGNGLTHVQTIDPTDLKVVKDVSTGANADAATLVSADGSRIYLESDPIAVLDASSLATIGRIDIPDGSREFGLSPDGSTLYAFFEGLTASNIAVANTATLKVENTFTIPGIADSNLLVSPDGAELYFTTSTLTGRGILVTVNTATFAISTAAIFKPVNTVAMAPNGSALFLANSTPDVYTPAGIAVFDLQSQTITSNHPTISYPEIALSSDGSALYALSVNTSRLGLTGTDPSLTPVALVTAGYNLLDGAFDSKDDLVLIPDSSGRMERFDGTTLAFKGYITIPHVVSVAYRNTGFALTGGELDPNARLVEFNPQNGQIESSAVIPYSGLNLVSYGTPAFSPEGAIVYFPYEVLPGNTEFPDTLPFVGILSIQAQPEQVQVYYPAPSTIAYVQGAVASNDGKKIYLSGASVSTPALITYDVNTGTIVYQLNFPENSPAISSPVLSPDGTTIYMIAGQSLYAVDVVSNQVIGSQPSVYCEISLTSDGKYLYITSFTSTIVASAATLEVLSTSALQVPEYSQLSPAILVN